MLSPGDDYKRVRKDPVENVVDRIALIRDCQTNRALRAGMIDLCRNDILLWINLFVWQFNPKQLGSEVGPFITWTSQDDAIRKTIDRLFAGQDDMLWEKSRYQGATWLALIVFDWAARFHKNKKFLCISHSADAVHKAGDPDSLLWKIGFIQDHLPGWMPKAVLSKMKVRYPATKSVITGAATSERSGVGGRATAVFLDEFAKQREDREILGQTADTGPRLFCSTHYGVGCAFYDLTQRPDMTKVIMHWSQNPEQNPGLYRSGPGRSGFEVIDHTYVFPPEHSFVVDGTPVGGPYPGLRSHWYDKECLRRASTRDVAMHLDINPAGSQSQFFDALMIRNLVSNCTDPWEGDLEYDPDHASPLRLRQMLGGPLKLWCVPTGECSVPPSKYGAGCDIATGLGRTPSVCSLADAATGFKVAELVTAHLTPERFAPLVVALCKLCSDGSQGALLNWEDKGPGLQFGRIVAGLYRRLWRRDVANIVRGRTATTELYGWVPGTDSKRRLLDSYRAALYDRAFVNRSEPALNECLNYRYSDRRDAVEHPRDIDGDDPSGSKSNHGDRVIADALAWLACVRLGAGTPGKPSTLLEAPAAIGSLQWRMELAEKATRNEFDARPVRKGSFR